MYPLHVYPWHHPMSPHYSPNLSWSPAVLLKQQPPCSSPNAIRLCQLHHSPALSGPMASHHTKKKSRKSFLCCGPHYFLGLISYHSPFLSPCSNTSASLLCLQHGKSAPVSRHFLLLSPLLLLLPPGRKISQLSAWSPPQFSQVFPLSVYS